MKNIITSLLALLGLASACGQQNFENADVNGFAAQIADPDVVLLDVRTEKEFNDGHIQNALNIDIKQSGFVEKPRRPFLPTRPSPCIAAAENVLLLPLYSWLLKATMS